jgi:hypothetical protein
VGMSKKRGDVRLQQYIKDLSYIQLIKMGAGKKQKYY